MILLILLSLLLVFLIVWWIYSDLDSIFFNPDRIIYPVCQRSDLNYSDVYIGSEENMLHGWFVHSPNKTTDLVLFVCHGTKGNLTTPFRVDLTRTLSMTGMDLFIFDYRGTGESLGRISRESVLADASRAWDHLVKDRGIPGDRIIVFGRSLGGPVAAFLASVKMPHLLVLESTFPVLSEEVSSFMPSFLSPLAKYVLGQRFNTQKHLRNVSCPVVFLHGDRDRLVPYRLGRKLFENYTSQNKIFVTMKGLGHKGFYVEREKYIDSFLEGLKRSGSLF